MSSGPEVSTDRGLPLEWWHVVAAGAAVWALFVATVDLEASMPTSLADSLTLLALVVWPAIPVATYLDIRAIDEDAAWTPATKSWMLVSLVWLANVSAGVAYCLRRASALRGEAPSSNWRFGVYAGLLGWIGLVAADATVEYASLGPLEPVLFGPVLFVVWFGFPVALYLDAVRVRAYTDLDPNVRILVALSAVPLLNLLVGAFYVGGRWWYVRKADPGAEPTLPGTVGGESGRAEPLSPWYRRAVGVFVVYFLAALGLGFGLSLESDLGWELLGLVVWPPFGLAFVGCLHFDLRDVRSAEVSWGSTRYLYYSSAVFPAPAFYYLLRRLTKVNRARSKGVLDGGGGPDEDRTGRGGDAATDAVRSGAATEEAGDDVGTAGGEDAGFEWGERSRG